MSDNPYSNRKPVTNPSQFYGRRHDVLLLAEKIRHGQMCALSGEPLIGKTSLLYYLIHPAGARSLPEFAHRLGDQHAYLFVLIELGRLPTLNARGLLRYLFDRVIEEAEQQHVEHKETRRAFEEARRQGDDYELQRLFEQYLKKLGKQHVAVFFDDFDIVLNEFERADAIKIMQKLRALAQALDLQDKFNCIFVSVDPLDELFKTSSFAIDAPLSRIITDYLSLGPLHNNEVEAFINGSSQNACFTSGDVTFIKQLAGRHPGMVKAACFHMFAAKYQQKDPITLDRIRQAIEKDPGVRWLMDTLWHRLERSGKQGDLALKDGLILLAQGRPPADPLIAERLHKRGLIDSSASDPWILGNIFRNYIQQKNAGVLSSTDSSGPYSSQDELNTQKLQGHLAPLEYKLYRYLAENADRTCARTELQKAIWGDKLPNSRDALEQLIKRVREKIEPHPDYPEYLLTVRGLGYLLRKKS